MAQVACDICSTVQHHSEADWNSWKCERCSGIVRGCRECTRKHGQMVVRVVLDGKHRQGCPPAGQ